MYPNHEAYIEYLKNKEIDLNRMRKRGRWHQYLQKELGEGFDVLFPSMPCSNNAQYNEWKLWFERVMEAVHQPCILIGHSLGAMFLTKYYSENEPKYTILELLLVAGQYLPVDEPGSERTSFTLTKDLNSLTKRAEKVVFFHSEDDPIVPYESFERYKREVSGAEYLSFSDRGHFLDETFPELADVVRSVEA